MKKLIVHFSALLICLTGISNDLSGSWVLTDEGRITCDQVVMTEKGARIILDNGQRLIIPISKVSSFSMDGKVYTKLPLYKDGKPTGKRVFMELIRTYGEMCLYKYGMCKMETPDPKIKIYCYFLYRGTNLHMTLDEKKLAKIDRNFEYLGLIEP